MTTQEKVAAIEKFPFWTNNKIELLLVIAGLKPAITVDVRGKLVSCKVKAQLPSRVRTHAIENLLQRIDVPFVTLPAIHRMFPKHDEQYYTTIICIGATTKDARDLAKVWTNITTLGYPAKSQDAEHGRLSGFPKTAISAFVSDQSKLLSNEVVDERTKNIEWHYFCQMRFTKAHWQEELAVVEKWAEAVKELSPNMYSKVVKE